VSYGPDGCSPTIFVRVGSELMSGRLRKKLKIGVPFVATLAFPFCLSAQKPTQGTRSSIHVESDEVLVSTLVMDKKTAGPMAGLSATDFRLFQDGVEQRIQKVVRGAPNSLVRDSLGSHVIYAGAGGGRWSSADRPSDWSPRVKWGPTDQYDPVHDYLIAYVPPPEPEGTCHDLTVTVSRPNAEVYARNRYCYIEGGLFDALGGSEYGERLESELASGRHGKIKFAVSTFVFRAETRARIYVRIDFPWRSMQCQAIDVNPTGVLNGPHVPVVEPVFTFGILGVVSAPGKASLRFTDFADWSGVSQPSIEPTLPLDSRKFPWGCSSLWNGVPTRYETQMILPSGNYDFRLALSDGSKFGSAEVPLNIEPYDARELAISAPVLVHRFRKAPTDGIHEKLAVKFVPLISKGIEVTPTADTRFEKGELLVTYFEIYEPLLASQPGIKVESHIRIVDAKKSTIIKDFDGVDVASYEQPGNTTIPVARMIPFDKLPKGKYRLEVQATDSAGHTTDWRGVDFSIENEKKR